MAKKADNTGAFQALKDALREKKPHHLYIFHGEGDYLRTYYLSALKKLACCRRLSSWWVRWLKWT